MTHLMRCVGIFLGEPMIYDNHDIQYRGKGKGGHKKRFGFALENLQVFRDVRRNLQGAQARRLSEYLIDILAEETDPVSWRRMLGEARRRVTLYFPED
jgi:hypothetical protein